MTTDSTATDLEVGQATNVAAESAASKSRRSGSNQSVKDLTTRHDETLSGEKVIITIPDTKDDLAKGPVFIGLNGIGYLIPRGKPCLVPREVLEILDNAVEKAYDAADGKTVVESEVPRHNYSTREATKRAVDALQPA